MTAKVKKSIDEFGKPGALATLSPNGGTVGYLNSLPVNAKPKLAFGGAESTPTLWRQVESLINSPADLAPDEESDAFIPFVIDALADIYFSKYVENQVKAFNAWNILGKSKFTNRGNAWIDGFIWFKQSNGKWQVLIGAGGASVTQKTKMLQVVHHGPCDNEVVEKERTYTVSTNTPNDGIVVLSSALALPGANLAESLANVNHQQCVNHQNVTTAMAGKVFGGGGHSFFKCDPR